MESVRSPGVRILSQPFALTTSSSGVSRPCEATRPAVALPLLYSSRSGAWLELRIIEPAFCSWMKVFCWKLTVTSGCAALNSLSALVQAMPSELVGSSNHQMLKVLLAWAWAAPTPPSTMVVRPAAKASRLSTFIWSPPLADRVFSRIDGGSARIHRQSFRVSAGPSGRLVDEFAAAAILEVIQRPYLTGHFERIAVYRVMPALDVDRAGPAGEAQLGNDVDPVAVAEPRRAHEDELLLAENAVLLDHFPAHRRILAVHVEKLVRPFADLRQGIDEIDELVARLPFEAAIVRRQRVEDQFPGVGVMGDVPVARSPVAVHRAVLEGDFDALVLGPLVELAPDFLVAREAVGQRLAAHAAGEAGDAGRAEMMGVVYGILPGGERRQVGIPAFQRVAEDADGRDRNVAVADRFEAALAQLGEVLAIGRLPEERLEAFEAEIGDLGDALVRTRLRRLDHGADTDSFCGVGHGNVLQTLISTRDLVRPLSIAAKTMARLLMLSLPAVSGMLPVFTALRKSAMTLAWPCVCDSSSGSGTSSGASSRKKPSSPMTLLASNLS